MSPDHRHDSLSVLRPLLTRSHDCGLALEALAGRHPDHGAGFSHAGAARNGSVGPRSRRNASPCPLRPITPQVPALSAGVRQIPLAGGVARRSGTLAYGRQAIRVASLLWSIGETCVDAGLGVYELWLCSREPRCRRAAVEFL